MIIFIINQFSVLTRKAKRHTPVSANLHRPSAATTTVQLMQIEAWQIHIARSRRHVQSSKDQTEPRGVLRLDTGRRTRFKEATQILVLEAENRHCSSVTWKVTGVN